MATSLQRELIVCGYVHNVIKTHSSLDVPLDIIKVIIMFYPCYIEFIGNKVELTDKEKEIITLWFIDLFNLQNKSCILCSNLLYDYTKDKAPGRGFYNDCLNAKNTFSIIQTKFNDHVFGCFLSKPFPKRSATRVEDDKAFLCLIRSGFKEKILEPKIFKIKPERASDAYIQYKNDLPCFGTSYDLQLSCKFPSYCDHDDTIFDNGINGNILCGGDEYNASNSMKDFEIKNMTTFEINIL